MDNSGEIKQRFFDVIDIIADEEDISRAQIARAMHIDPSTFTKVLDGSTKQVSASLFRRLKKAYHVNLTWIETGIGEKFLAPHERIEDVAEKSAVYDPGAMNGNLLLETMRQALQRFMELNINQETEILELRDRLKKLDQDEKATEKSG